jgi:hypothetical protein
VTKYLALVGATLALLLGGTAPTSAFWLGELSVSASEHKITNEVQVRVARDHVLMVTGLYQEEENGVLTGSPKTS